MTVREHISDMVQRGEIARTDIMVLVREQVLIAGISTASTYKKTHTLYAVRRNSRKKWVLVFYISGDDKDLVTMAKDWCGLTVAQVLEDLDHKKVPGVMGGGAQ